MDTLIEIIVRALIALFSGGQQKQMPPPRTLPKIPPVPRRAGQPVPRRYPPRPPALRGPAAIRGIPIPQSIAPPPPPKREQPTMAPPPSAAQPQISAAAIRQLMLARRSALRTIYVLSEVVGPPVGLRE